jgi:hypothetical protein
MRSIIGWLAASLLGSLGWWLGHIVGIGTALLARISHSEGASDPAIE